MPTYGKLCFILLQQTSGNRSQRLWKNVNFAIVIAIERHIEVLLLDNDCVIVPGFGGFTAHHVDARFDGRDCNYLPPIRTLGFNQQLKMNDSLLAQSYSDTYDISYPEALRRIEAEVATLTAELETTGRYDMDDIGTLVVNSEGKYEFEPCEAGILTPEFYGLGAIEVRPLGSESDGDSRLADEHVRKAAHGDGNRQREMVCVRLSTLRYVAAACIAALVVWLLPAPVETPGKPKVIKAGIDAVESCKAIGGTIAVAAKPMAVEKEARMGNKAGKGGGISAEQPRKAISKVEAPKVRKEDSHAERAAAGSVAETETAGGYCIVLASKVARKNAEGFAKDLRRRGYGSARVHPPKNSDGKVVRVVYGNYSTEKEAVGELNKLRTDKDFAQGWVMEII